MRRPPTTTAVSTRELSRVERATRVITLATTTYSLLKQGREWYQKKVDERSTDVEVFIEDIDVLFLPVTRHLYDLLPVTAKKTIDLIGNRGRDKEEVPLFVMTSPETSAEITISGVEVKVSWEEGGYKTASGGSTPTFDDEPDSTKIKKSRGGLTFICQSHADRQQIIDWIEAIANKENQKVRKSEFRVVDKFGNWRYLGEAEPRSIESVVLPEGQMERIVSDIERFQSDEERERYNEIGVPYHRGFLFHGPPGTGKSSLAKVLAQRFDMDLWYVPLGDLDRDSDLMSLITSIERSDRSVLLLEDIDVFSASRDRDGEDDTERLSLSGLLNALDGVMTPSGLITIMTTNDIDSLDSALIRPGRVDRAEKIDYLTEEQARRIWERFYKTAPPADLPIPESFSAADLIEIIKRSWDDPESAYTHLTNTQPRK